LQHHQGCVHERGVLAAARPTLRDSHRGAWLSWTWPAGCWQSMPAGRQHAWVCVSLRTRAGVAAKSPQQLVLGVPPAVCRQGGFGHQPHLCFCRKGSGERLDSPGIPAPPHGPSACLSPKGSPWDPRLCGYWGCYKRVSPAGLAEPGSEDTCSVPSGQGGIPWVEFQVFIA
jgi:hypothetical protein